MGRGKDESRVRLSPRVGSVNSYVVSWVASPDGFSRILELRFQIRFSGSYFEFKYPQRIADYLSSQDCLYLTNIT